MKYKIQKVKNKFHLIENSTGFLIARDTIKKNLNQIKKHMESGGAFNGNTPEFMAEKV